MPEKARPDHLHGVANATGLLRGRAAVLQLIQEYSAAEAPSSTVDPPSDDDEVDAQEHPMIHIHSFLYAIGYCTGSPTL